MGCVRIEGVGTSTPRPAVRSVLMTADPSGGAWTYAMELSRGLARRGVMVHLATMGGRLSQTQRREAGALDALTLHESSFKLEWMDDPWDDVDAAGEWLLGLDRAIKPDIVHLGSLSHGALPWQAPCVVVVQSCVLSWWEAVRQSPFPSELDTYRQRVRLGLGGADLVIAPTLAMLCAVERLHGRFPPMAVIWNARSAGEFSPGAKKPIVLGAGRVWDAAKNLTALDAVAERLPWRVQIAGELVAPHGASARLRHAEWLGVLPVEVMREALACASIYAVPARYESFGLSAARAALAGCALVLGDLPGMREIWEDAAMFVPPDDPDALEYVLRYLIDNPGERAALADRARASARSRTPDLMASAYLAHYHAARSAMVA